MTEAEDDIFIARREHLARYLEDEVEPHNFDMEILVAADRWHSFEETLRSLARHECGSVACIAGHAIVLFGPMMPFDRTRALPTIGDFLGLIEREYAYGPPKLFNDMSIKTPQEAANVLREINRAALLGRGER